MTDPLEQHLLAQTAGRQAHFWHEVRALPVTTRLVGEPGELVVDVGAGSGVLGDIVLRDRPSVRYRFIEPLEPLAAQLVARFGPDSRILDLADCRDGTIVTLLDVIEHLEAPRPLLADAITSAPPGSFVIITVPAFPWLWSSWDESLGHHRRYTKRSLLREVDGLPIEIVELAYLFPELLLPAVGRRLLRSRRAQTPASSEFPLLPSWLDKLLLAVAKGTYAMRRWWPAGTSVLLVARRR